MAPDGFGIVEKIAEALGGAVGATRAAVDSGWIPYSQQIGQTGKIVKPELYLALGISGAIQHKVGMRTSGTIVAVNRDAGRADRRVRGPVRRRRPVRGRDGARSNASAPGRAERGRAPTPMRDRRSCCPIAAFIALAAGLAVVLRGTGRIVARTREVEQFRGAVKRSRGPGRRVARRRRGPDRRRPPPPGRPGHDRRHGRRRHDAVERYTDEAKALRGPRQTRRIRPTWWPSWSAPQRALEMVEHGTTIMVNVRRGPRELEAQTSIKRGYLNLIHAREAIARRALDAQSTCQPTTAAQTASRTPSERRARPHHLVVSSVAHHYP